MPKTPPKILSILAIGLCLACASPDASAPPPAPSKAESPPPTLAEADAPFRDVAADVGLDFVHWNGMTGRFFYPEMMGSGAALIDYDGDGDLDVYLVQGALLGDARAEDTVFPAPERLGDRLFRNDLQDGKLRFVDVTEEVGLVGHEEDYGMGALAADFDNDGRVDLYVANLGPDRLWRNTEEGFEDATAAFGVEQNDWSVPVIALDADVDDRLDLFIGRYVAWDADTDPSCTDELGLRNYCGPLSFKPRPDALLLGRPGSRFEDATGVAGLRRSFGGALGAVAADFNGDGRLDLYVANDGVPNQLWLREPTIEPRYAEAALLSGAAVSGEGKPEASMGVAVADYDGDGDEDLFLTHLDKETNTLYRNDGSGVFDDVSLPSGLGAPSRPFTGFGAAFLDWDLDGVLDALVVDGAVKNIKERALAGDELPLRQSDLLFRGLGDGRFEQVDGGPAFAVEAVSRGAAFGDLDNDGDPDVVVIDNSGAARLLLNQTVDPKQNQVSDRHWLGLRLTLNPAGASEDVERDAWGALAVVRLADGRELRRRIGDMPSYASSSDPRLLFGLGDHSASVDVSVRWPDGRQESWDDLAVDRYTRLRRGEGTPLHGESP